MNVFTIIAGLAVLGISVFMGFIGAKLFIIGGTTAFFGGIAMAVLTIMVLGLGVVLIGLGWAGVVAQIRKG